MEWGTAVYTSSTAANGVQLLYIGNYRGDSLGVVDYVGHPGFSGWIPPGYKYIDITLYGNAMYFNIDGASYGTSARHVFRNPNVGHSWGSEAENIGNRTYRYGLQIVGYTN